MVRKELVNCENAISTVVSVVLLLGLAVALVAVINVTYIPEMKTSAEFDHMGNVYEDMSRIKSNSDLMAVAMAVDDEIFFSMDMPVRMGGGHIPIIGRERSSGSLVLNDEDVEVRVTAYNSSNDISYEYVMPDLGSLRYNSNNRYFMDQSFVLENGALFVVQGNRDLMKLAPSMRVDKVANSSLSIRMSAIGLFGNRGSVTSNDVEYARMESNSSKVLFNNDMFVNNVTIDVKTSYASSWAEHFTGIASKAGLSSPVDYEVKTNSNSASVSFYTGANDSIDLYLQEHTIDTRLNSLWVPY